MVGCIVMSKEELDSIKVIKCFIEGAQTTKHCYLSKKREQNFDFNVCYVWEMICAETG